MSSETALPILNPQARPYYLKSRTGCLFCKQRKIKCDEKYPLCGNCAKRYPGMASCRKPNVNLNGRAASSDSDRPVSSSISLQKTVMLRPNHIHDTTASQQLEDMLIAHYVGVLQKSLPDHEDKSGRRVWEFEIPQLAFSDPNVRGAVMCISAIHLRALLPDDRIDRAAGYYFGKTVRKHRQNMVHLDSTLAEPLIITAMILIYYTWQASLDRKLTRTYALPLETFHMEKGFFALIAKLNAHGMGLSKHCQWLLDQKMPDLVDDTVSSTPFFETFRASLNRLLDAMPVDVHPEDEAEFRGRVAISTAICYELTTGVSQVEVRRALVMTVSHSSYRYMELLKTSNPIAIALFAHLLAMAHVIDHVWWLHGPRELHIERYHFLGTLQLMPRESLWMMQWPVDVFADRIPLEIQLEGTATPTSDRSA